MTLNTGDEEAAGRGHELFVQKLPHAVNILVKPSGWLYEVPVAGLTLARALTIVEEGVRDGMESQPSLLVGALGEVFVEIVRSCEGRTGMP
jgi:hypothetical protein